MSNLFLIFCPYLLSIRPSYRIHFYLSQNLVIATAATALMHMGFYEDKQVQKVYCLNMNLLFKCESCELFFKIKTIVECESYHETLKNYYDDPTDGILWSKVAIVSCYGTQ